MTKPIGAGPITHQLDNSTQAHYMLGMSDNVVSLAEWKAAHQPNPDERRVPVYVPVRDPAGRWRLELTGTTTLEPEFQFYVDPS
jgi:hypothetical protein